MNFKAYSLSSKLILGAAALAIISLFLPWVDLGLISASGFQQQGYLFLVIFIYPVYCVLKNVPLNRIGGIVCGILGIVASIAYYNSKSGEIFGTAINLAGIGIYVFLISTIILTIGAYLTKK